MEYAEKEKEFFKERLYNEIIYNERIRATILAGVSFLVVLIFAVYLLFFGDNIEETAQTTAPLYFVMGIFGIFFFRELLIAFFPG